MKIEKEKKFTPVTIVLETQEELDQLTAVVNHSTINDGDLDELNDFLIEQASEEHQVYFDDLCQRLEDHYVGTKKKTKPKVKTEWEYINRLFVKISKTYYDERRKAQAEMEKENEDHNFYKANGRAILLNKQIEWIKKLRKKEKKKFVKTKGGK